MTWGKIIQWRRRRSTSATAGFKFKSPSPEQYPRSDNKPLVPVLPSWAPGNELSHTGGSWTLDVGQVYTGGLHVERVSCILISFFVRLLLCLAILLSVQNVNGSTIDLYRSRVSVAERLWANWVYQSPNSATISDVFISPLIAAIRMRASCRIRT